jgi:DNA repair exonuclease SbcCD nuclease subunit
MKANLPADKARIRRGEIFAAFSGMLDFAERNSVDAVIIAGDLFDSPKVSIKTKRSTEDAIRAHGGIDFFVLTGNHDKSPSLFDAGDAPQNFKPLYKDGGWTRYDLGGVVICGIRRAVYDSLILNAHDINIAVMHGEASNYNKDDSSETVLLPKLKDKYIDYLALGHFHGFFKAPLDRRGTYCYSGCLEGRGFDESGAKGFVLLDIDTADKKIVSRFVPFSKRLLTEVTVDISEASSMYAVEKSVDEALKDIAPSGLVKVVLTGRYDGGLHKDLKRLSDALNGRFFFCKVKDESKLAVKTADYLRDISLKGEFVRLVLADKILSDDDKADIIDCGLKALQNASAYLK